MSDGGNVIYTYDGSFEGLLSAIYRAVHDRREPEDICCEDVVQAGLFSGVKNVPADFAAAKRVQDAVFEKIGGEAARRAYYAFLSERKGLEMVIYRFLMFGFAHKKDLFRFLGERAVLDAFTLSNAVGREIERMRGFLRFSVMEGGVHYAAMEPDYNILPRLAPHFATRMRGVPFVIHDAKRGIAAFYDTKTWLLTPARDMTLPELSPDEEHFRELWREFYGAIAISSRVNPDLRRNLMPKKYWRYLTEMNLPLK